MLVKYSSNYQKIAMGFMSYIPELKDWDHLQMELGLYTSDQSHQLFLYKNQQDNFIGVIALELQDRIIMVRYISLSPAYRSTQNLFQILDAVQEYYPQAKIMGTIDLTPLIEKWNHLPAAHQND